MTKWYCFEITGLSKSMMLEFKALADDNELDYKLNEVTEKEIEGED